MENGIETQSTTPQASAPAPVTTPAADVQAPSTPSYPTYSALPATESGSGSKFGGWFDGIKLSEVMFGMLAVVGVLYVIRSSSYVIKEGRVFNKDLTRRVDALEQNIIALQAKTQQAVEQQPASFF